MIVIHQLIFQSNHVSYFLFVDLLILYSHYFNLIVIRTQRSQSCLSSSRSEMSVNTAKSLKSNPVNRYHEYRKLWNRQKGPGEKKHSDLRWSIREQMLEARDVTDSMNIPLIKLYLLFGPT